MFERAAHRRIVLATNVAETSLTVPGIHYVIDTGLARVKRYSPRQKIDQLRIEPISQAAARQRAGRCGRVASGIAIRLYAEEDFDGAARVHHAGDPAHLARRGDPAHGRARAGPDRRVPVHRAADAAPDRGRLPAALRAGRDRRSPRRDRRLTLTPLGQELARLPVDPRIGRMLLAAREFHCAAEMVILAAALSIQDPRDRPQALREASDRAHEEFRDDASDFLQLHEPVEVLRQRVRAQEVQPQALRDLPRALPLVRAHARVARPRRAAARDGRRAQASARTATPATYEQIHRALLTGLIGNVGMKAQDGDHYHGPRGMQFHIWPGLGAEEEPPALDHGGRAAGDHARLRAQRGAHRARLDRAGRGAPRRARLRRAALGQGARRGGRLRERVALRPRAGRAAQGELRADRPGARARDLHRGRAGGRGVRDAAPVLGAQPQARARGGGAGAPRAPPRRAGGRRARSTRSTTTRIPPDVRDARSFDAWYREAAREGARSCSSSRATDLMRHGAESVTEELFPRQLQIGRGDLPARLPLRARPSARRRHDQRAARAPEPARRRRRSTGWCRA